MGTGAALTAWFLAVLPLVLATELEVAAPGGHVALALLPWMALAGLPRSASSERSNGAALVLALLLPSAVFAARLDVAAGVGPGPVLLVLGVGFAVVLLLGWAAERGARGGPFHGAGWWLFVAGPPILSIAVALSTERDAPVLLRRLAAISPLEQAWRLARGVGDTGGLALTCVTAGLLALLARPGRGAGRWEQRP